MKRLYILYFLVLCSPLFPGVQMHDLPGFAGGKDHLQVLPSPGNGVFTVIYKSETKGEVVLSVTDATGKYVFLKTIRDFDGDLKEVVDLSGLPKGIYIFEAERDSSRENKKVIHQ